MDAALYCVATPIGNLGDITARAVDTLRQADVIYAEDTRVTRKLLTSLGIQNRLLSLHEHNEERRVADIRDQILSGVRVALVSDAGTPLISDPGYQLVSQLSAQDVRVIPIPGASAIIAALSAAGLPTDRFVFEGFLPARAGPRRKALETLQHEARTLVLYESSHRIAELLADLEHVLGGNRELVIARELTKLYEQFYRGTVSALREQLQADADMRRGEFVVMVAGAAPVDDEDVEGQTATLDSTQLLTVLLDELPVKQAARLAARLTGLPKNRLYRQAMTLQQAGSGV
ncbi:MAG: 16S rRNA (cytidine(1402)-2'-O)-methyltransferase [Thiolinea sp.]